MDLTYIPSYYQYWGKAELNLDGSHDFHLLPYHSLDVAAVGYSFISSSNQLQSRLAQFFPWKYEYTLQLVSFYLAIHDIGKYSESFQKLIPDVRQKLGGEDTQKKYNLRHDSLGYLIWNSVVWPDIVDHGFLDLWGGEGDSIIWQCLLQPCATAVFGHHGKPPDNQAINNADPDTLFSPMDESAACLFVKECQNFFLKDPFPVNCLDLDILEKKFKKFSWFLSGIAVLSDWIGSDSSHFSFVNEVIDLNEYWTNIALPSAHTGLIDSGIGSFSVSQKTGVRSLFPWFGGAEQSDNCNTFSPSPLQEYVSTCKLGSGPHLFIIEESTGGGKTEAAVALAHRMMVEGAGEGMYIALPTMATANAMYERMKECYLRLYQQGPRPSLILSHGSRHLSEAFRDTIGPPISIKNCEYGTGEIEASAVCAGWLSDHRKASLLASIGVGTIDQALVSVLPASHQSLRLLGLFRNVLVVDEVHAYDPFMNRLLRSLLAFHAALGGSSILLSATLPREQRVSYLQSFAEGAGFKRPEVTQDSYPLVTHLSQEGCKEEGIIAREGTGRSVSLEFHVSEESAISKIADVIDSGGCACWIRNTVVDALSAFDTFSKIYSSDQVFLFHARFVMGDRIEIEKRVIQMFGKESGQKERVGKLLIATQVVEQSLDIDFDYLVTDLAPIDLIIQRAGRLHRHKREGRGNPTLGIYTPPFSDNPDDSWYSSVFRGGAFVYPSHGELWLTLQILQKLGEIKTPDDARTLIEWVYGKNVLNNVPEGLRKRDEKAKQEQIKAEGTAMMNALPLKKGYISEGERWDDDEKAKTRYGEPSVILRLGVIEKDTEKIIPIFREGHGSWELSSVSVRRSLIPETILYSELVHEMVQTVKKDLPDKGKWSYIIPLEPENGEYSATISGNKDGFLDLKYSRLSGLSIRKLNDKI